MVQHQLPLHRTGVEQNTRFSLNAAKPLAELAEAKAAGIAPKVNLIGPITYLALSKNAENRADTFAHFDSVLAIYEELFVKLAQNGACHIQIDEPLFAKDADQKALSLLRIAYQRLGNIPENLKLIVTTYFEATRVLLHTPVYGVGLDFLYGEQNLESLEAIAKSGKQLFAGVIDGRNVWRNNIEKTVELLTKISETVDKKRRGQ